MRYIQIFLVVGLLGVAACQSNNNDKELPSEEVEQVIQAYLELKDALVLTDYEESRQKVEVLHELLHNSSDEGLKEVAKSVESMMGAEDVASQRIHFSELTQALDHLISGGSRLGTVYKQYCPMAFDNEGGYWFSLEEEVVNPYFGDEMLHCGRVADEY